MLNAGNPTVVVAVKDEAAVDRAWGAIRGRGKDEDTEGLALHVL
jgi:hypothetical protein